MLRHPIQSAQRACLGGLLLGLSLSAARLLAADPAAELAALQKRYEESKGSYEERVASVRADYLAFIKAHAQTEESVEAQLFLLQQTWWEREKGTMNTSAGRIADDLLASHLASPKLGKLVEFQYVFSAAQRREIFSKLLKSSPHEGVRAEAVLGLAQVEQRSKEAGAADKAKALLTELSEKYGKLLRRGITPYAEVASAWLSPHDPAALAIGQVAPEIEGRDVDGKVLKLSQFRGRVVVIDFWGDW